MKELKTQHFLFHSKELPSMAMPSRDDGVGGVCKKQFDVDITVITGDSKHSYISN